MASFEKRGEIWTARFREEDIDGNVRQKRLSGFKTKREAQEAFLEYEKAEEERRAREIAEREAARTSFFMPFEELCEKFLVFKKSRVKNTSFCDVKSRVNNHILPYFEGMKIGEITPADVLSWMGDLTKYSYNYQKLLFSLMASIFAFGNKYHGSNDPTKLVDRPRKTKKPREMEIYTPEEFASLKEHFKKKEYGFFFYFLFMSGCRRGEALALTWKDFDEKKGLVNIKKSYSKKVDEKGKGFVITTPKNDASERKVFLPKSFFRAFDEYKKCADTSLTYVFGGEKPFPVTNLQRALCNASDAAGLTRIRIHDLRHSCASYLLHKGVSVVAVSHHLGHKSIEQTLKTYAHILPDDKTAILENLGTLELGY